MAMVGRDDIKLGKGVHSEGGGELSDLTVKYFRYLKIYYQIDNLINEVQPATKN